MLFFVQYGWVPPYITIILILSWCKIKFIDYCSLLFLVALIVAAFLNLKFTLEKAPGFELIDIK